MNLDERNPVDLVAYRHRRGAYPRPSLPPPPPYRPADKLARYIRELVAEVIHEHVQELHSGRAS